MAPNQHSATRYENISAIMAGANARLCSTQIQNGAPLPPRDTSWSLSQPPTTVESDPAMAMKIPFATAKSAARAG
eukprot:scaffold55974_cov33-Tisochrysis_lutea.AAC.2